MTIAGPGIYRFNRPDRGYTPIAHQFARSTLPARAIKVGLYVLSHRDGYVQTQRAIGAAIGMGVDTVAAALTDLEAARFLVRHDVRDQGGHRIGTAYAVTDVPFTDDELTTLTGGDSPDRKSPHGKNPSGKSRPPKKTTPVRETKKSKKNNPSGGVASPSATPPANAQEDPDMPRTPQAEALFDLPPAPRRAAPPATGPQQVVAAYVESFRRSHGGEEPSKTSKGIVARHAKALLSDRAVRATLPEVTEAARSLGVGRYTNLDMQLKINRDQGKRTGTTKGLARVVANGQAWDQGSEATDAAAAEALAANPELAAFMAGAA